jgi:Family of unknown function (DUF6879)
VAERPTFDEMFARCTRSAVHLEMRDMYTPDDPVYLDWKSGIHIDAAERWHEWYVLMVATVARGVEVRRARIVSEPVTDFIRHEYDLTDGLNIAAGERVRWLPRRQASDLALPGNDFWVFDDQLVRFGHFAGDGTYLCQELIDDPSVVKLCSSAFESVWERAINHQDYHPK